MARMLQALKNLEARSARSAAKPGLLDHLIAVPPSDPSPAEPPAPRHALAAESAPRELFDDWLMSAQQQLLASAPLEIAAATIVIDTSVNTPEIAAPAPLIVSLPDVTQAGPSRAASSLENVIRRTLSDPIRSRPLKQLAERLRADIRQTASKSVLLVGVGPECPVHEPALYAAALLADDGAGAVLVVDGDLTRRTLSMGLEAETELGLAELLRGDRSAQAPCRRIALSGVSLLPAGAGLDADPAAVASRLDGPLQQLTGRFSLVVIDGGRTTDPSAIAWARAADATYFVVRLGTVEASTAQAALSEFRAAGARVLGCIAT